MLISTRRLQLRSATTCSIITGIAYMTETHSAKPGKKKPPDGWLVSSTKVLFFKLHKESASRKTSFGAIFQALSTHLVLFVLLSYSLLRLRSGFHGAGFSGFSDCCNLILGAGT